MGVEAEESMRVEHRVYQALSGCRFNLSHEKTLQAQIEKRLKAQGIEAKREHCLGDAGEIDFYVDGLGIEIKIKGQKKNIYRQCERYCAHESINALMLVTNVAMGMSETLHGKDIFVLDLGRAHL